MQVKRGETKTMLDALEATWRISQEGYGSDGIWIKCPGCDGTGEDWDCIGCPHLKADQ